MVEIKFCGMTRPVDAESAAAAGADYVGVVFAGGPRVRDEGAAASIYAALPARVRRAGVFGAESATAIAARAGALGLHVVQLHGDPRAVDVARLRDAWGGEIWTAVRVDGAELPAHAEELFAAADAVLLDAQVAGTLGGSGVALAWNALARAVRAARDGGPARLVLAGGLRPENVREAIRELAPDIVDVSSGIESVVGIKDPARMRAFRDAVRLREGVR